MSSIDWTIIAIMGLAAVLMIGIVLRKWRVLTTVDVAAMPEVQMRKKKYTLIEQRLNRKMQSGGKSAGSVFVAIGQVFTGLFKTIFDKLVEQERKYRMAGLEASEGGAEKTRQKVSALLQEGRVHFKEGNIVEAENVFVDVVRLQPNETEAYSVLAQIYMKKKEYENAIETLKHLRKLDSEQQQVYFDLGCAYEEAGELENAVESYKTAVELEPKNPRNLDALLKAAIEVEDRFMARDALRRLKEADPENGKIEELQKKIDEL